MFCVNRPLCAVLSAISIFYDVKTRKSTLDWMCVVGVETIHCRITLISTTHHNAYMDTANCRDIINTNYLHLDGNDSLVLKFRSPFDTRGSFQGVTLLIFYYMCIYGLFACRHFDIKNNILHIDCID